MKNKTGAGCHKRSWRAQRRPNDKSNAHQERTEHLIIFDPINECLISLTDLLWKDQDENEAAGADPNEKESGK